MKLAKQASVNGAVAAGDDVDMSDDLGLGARLLGNGTAQEGAEDEGDALVCCCATYSSGGHFAHSDRAVIGPAPAQRRARHVEQGSEDDCRVPRPAVRAPSSPRCSFASALMRSAVHSAAKAGKTTGAAADTEYRAVLDSLIADLLATLHLAEWPGSEVLLTVLCRSMMATLADPKSTHESNALKGLALDYIGTIAARIRQDLSAKATGLRSLREVRSHSSPDAQALLTRSADNTRGQRRHAREGDHHAQDGARAPRQDRELDGQCAGASHGSRCESVAATDRLYLSCRVLPPLLARTLPSSRCRRSSL